MRLTLRDCLSCPPSTSGTFSKKLKPLHCAKAIFPRYGSSLADQSKLSRWHYTFWNFDQISMFWQEEALDFLYFHYNPRLQCSNNMCASVFQHIFTALALQLHCSSDKDNKYMLDIFSLQFVRLQLEMKSNIQSFPPLPTIRVPRHLHISTFTHHDFLKGLLPIIGLSWTKDIYSLGLLSITGLSWKKASH